MKKIIAIMLCGMIAVMMIGCAAEAEPSATPTPTATPTATPTPEPTPTPTPEPAQVVLMDIPEAEMANFQVPKAYQAVDTANDTALPINPGYTIYTFEDVNGAVQYRAFGQKINPADNAVLEQGFYAVTITDESITPETFSALSDGERVVVVAINNGIDDGHEAGDIIDSYIVGDTEKPFDTALFDKYAVVRKIITFDSLNAVPVDLEAEAATYAPEPTPEPEPEKENNSGKSNNGGSSSSSGGNGSKGSGSSSSGSSGGGSSSGGSGGNSSSGNEGQNLEDQLPDEFDVYWDEETYINNEDWYN